MDIILGILGIYLAIGICAIILLDLLTKRVRSRLKTASVDTQLLTGDNPKIAIAITILALWIFWPFAIYAAIRR